MSYVYLRRTTILLVLMSVSACNGGGNASQALTMEYAKTVSVADGTLVDYMNADWLYQNYLGEYDFPAEVKPLFIPELQMLANGFALQFKRGEDVRLSIKQCHKSAMIHKASSRMAQFVSQVKQDPEALISMAAGGGALREPPANATIMPRRLSAEEQASVDLGKLRRAREDAEWERVRREYSLPYELPGRIEKWLNCSWLVI